MRPDAKHALDALVAHAVWQARPGISRIMAWDDRSLATNGDLALWVDAEHAGAEPADAKYRTALESYIAAATSLIGAESARRLRDVGGVPLYVDDSEDGGGPEPHPVTLVGDPVVQVDGRYLSLAAGAGGTLETVSIYGTLRDGKPDPEGALRLVAETWEAILMPLRPTLSLFARWRP